MLGSMRYSSILQYSSLGPDAEDLVVSVSTSMHGGPSGAMHSVFRRRRYFEGGGSLSFAECELEGSDSTLITRRWELDPIDTRNSLFVFICLHMNRSVDISASWSIVSGM